MLDARYIASLSDDLIELYGQLEYEIKKDIFRRLYSLKKVTDATVYQTEILQQVGGLKSDLNKLLLSFNTEAQKELLALYKEAMTKALKNDLRHYSTASRYLSKEQTQVINLTIDRLLEPERINKTYAQQSRQFQEIYSNLVRMTATVADSTEKVFIKSANNAYMKVSSGAFTWDRAYKDAVKEIATNGPRVTSQTPRGNIINTPAPVMYTGSGTIRQYSIETAVRMNILTGINQTATQQTLEVADELGADLVEVSAHIGARPEHEEWQGKVYCLDGERDYIDGTGIKRHAPNFYQTCKLGEATGICGINCRHSFYPYFEGTPLEYSNGELSEMADKKVKLDGKEITPYEAEQELRLCERNIRFYKSVVSGLENVSKDDPDYIQASNNLYKWQKNARHITNDTGLKRHYVNEYIGTKDGKQPRGLKPTE